jgi:hypothetical protein
MAIFGRNPKLKRPAKIFCKAHNFVPCWNFDKRIFVFKLWDAVDADCGIAHGIARVNPATRTRAIGTYFTGQFLVIDL